jgi:hypothetical protein
VVTFRKQPMSHVAAVDCIVLDLDILKVAGERLGLEFIEGQKTHRWFGRFLNDWSSTRAAAKKGYDHALRIKGDRTGYEIGVTKRDDEDGFDLVYDSFGVGQQLERLAGVDLVTLRNEVAVETVTRHLPRGFRVTREESTATRIHLRAIG